MCNNIYQCAILFTITTPAHPVKFALCIVFTLLLSVYMFVLKHQSGAVLQFRCVQYNDNKGFLFYSILFSLFIW